VAPQEGAVKARDLVRTASMRLLARGHRAVSRTHRQIGVVRFLVGEVPLVLYTPWLERASIHDFHETTRAYVGDAQRAGLHPFEQRLVRAYFPPPPARVLVHGAGGGREALALCDLGYAVEAHEPVLPMRRAAADLLAGRAPVGALSLQAWAQRPTGRFDAVVLGWGLWSYVIRQVDRLEALRSLQRVCAGPVLMSFFRTGSPFSAREDRPALSPLHPTWSGGRVRFTRHTLRERVLGLPPLERGIGWNGHSYYHSVDPAELREEAALASMRVVWLEEDAWKFPSAVLVAI
jgi:hypothetical protein